MEFGPKLKEYRERAGVNQRQLALAAGLDPASINRFESGQRSPARRADVERLAAELGLGAGERDDLLWSAGYFPALYGRVPPTDPTLVLVARVLADDHLSEAEKAEYRTVVAAISRRWAGGSAAADGGGA